MIKNQLSQKLVKSNNHNIVAITEDNFRILIYNKDKRNISKHLKLGNTFHINLNENFIKLTQNHINMIRANSNLKNFNLSHYTYKTMLLSLFKLSTTITADSLLIEYYFRLIAEVIYKLKPYRAKETYIKSILNKISNKEIFIKGTVIITDKISTYSSESRLKAFLLISFLIRMGIVNPEEFRDKFSDVIFAVSSILPLNITNNDFISNYIYSITNIYPTLELDGLNMFHDLCEVIKFSGLNNLNAYIKIFRFYNEILLDPDYRGNEINVKRYFELVDIFRKNLAIEEYNFKTQKMKNEKLAKYSPDYEVNLISCIMVLLDSPLIYIVTHKERYISYVDEFIGFLYHLINDNFEVKIKIFYINQLCKIFRKHEDKFTTKALEKYIDFIETFRHDYEAYIRELDYEKVKSFRIRQQYLESIESIYPYIRRSV
jgi:hypothetical protein